MNSGMRRRPIRLTTIRGSLDRSATAQASPGETPRPRRARTRASELSTRIDFAGVPTLLPGRALRQRWRQSRIIDSLGGPVLSSPRWRVIGPSCRRSQRSRARAPESGGTGLTQGDRAYAAGASSACRRSTGTPTGRVTSRSCPRWRSGAITCCSWRTRACARPRYEICRASRDAFEIAGGAPEACVESRTGSTSVHRWRSPSRTHGWRAPSTACSSSAMCAAG